ncbi:redoxin family protein [Butyricimonas paravirosa]
MKTIMLSCVLFWLSTTVLSAQEGFKITGNAMNLPDGKVVLIEQGLQGIDTLGGADMVNGKFTIEGNVDHPCVGILLVAGVKGPVPVMLENTEFEVTIGVTETLVEGGEAQQVYNQYSEVMQECMRGFKKLENEYKEAAIAQNQMKMNILQKELLKNQEEVKAKELEWIKSNANHFVTAYVIYCNMVKGMPSEEVFERFKLLDRNVHTSFYGRVIATCLLEQAKVAVGAVAPDFSLVTPEGNLISLSDIKGKVKLIDFWASWCKPCRQENKNVVSIYKKYHDKGFEIFGVSMDKDKEKWMKAIQDDGLIWHHGSDLQGLNNSSVARQYFVRAIPHTLLLDENNRIVAKNLRGEALKKKIAEMLKE